jgi:hypothetical protein
MATHHPQPAILRDLTKECKHLFAKVFDRLKEQSMSKAQDSPNAIDDRDDQQLTTSSAEKYLDTMDLLQDQCVRFDVWSKNIGILASGRASLDYRVMYHEDIQDLLSLLLNMLRRNLLSCE